MSRMRPEIRPADPIDPSLGYEAAYFRVLQAVARRRRLAHGKLHDGALSCAIGSAFDDGVRTLPIRVIDEIALYNDSFPTLTPHERWKKVIAWLRFQTKVMAAKK